MKCKNCGHEEEEHCKTTKVQGFQKIEGYPCFHMDKKELKGEDKFISCECRDFEKQDGGEDGN